MGSQENVEMDDMVVSSGNLKLDRKNQNHERSANFEKNFFKSFGNSSKGFRWTDWSNSSITKKLNEMMESMERELEELLNETASYSDFFQNTGFFDMDDSFSFSSESASESEENDEEQIT